MHSILFAITRPPDDKREKLEAWNNIVKSLSETAKTNKEVETLGKGAWLFLRADGLTILGSALARAKEFHFDYRILIIEEATDWTPEKPV
jgi:hypothetical protein